MIPSEKARSGISPRGVAKNAAQKGNNQKMKLSDAVQESTSFVAKGTSAATVLLVLVFLVLHLLTSKVPFGIGVILSAVLGCLVAVGNFLLMAVVAEKAAGDDNYDNAKRKMTLSYRYRTLGQLVFVILVIVVPGLNFVAGILPLLVPGALIRGKGVADYKKMRAKERAEGRTAAIQEPEKTADSEADEAGRETEADEKVPEAAERKR